MTKRSRCAECRRIGVSNRAYHSDVETGRFYCDEHWDAFRKAVIDEEYPSGRGLIGHDTHTSRILRSL